uniref:Putative reverse transcriptase domain-containing protein n=1 Tax=Tanacetum cinerariifolium TaxID=118510 RepID=A0A699H4G1_TANCI|nr:putative reverse transcriptase domain-containing protein [Tanacetum cinerariifolium]
MGRWYVGYVDGYFLRRSYVVYVDGCFLRRWYVGYVDGYFLRRWYGGYVDGCFLRRCRMRELVLKYKAKKVCHEAMVKMPLVDLKSEYKERYQLRRPVSFGTYGDERIVGIITRAARGIEHEAKMMDELFSVYGCETKYHIGKANEVETSKAENMSTEMLRGLDQRMEKRDGVLETTNKVVLIKENLKVARDRPNSYVDKRRKPLEFEVGDRVLLKVSPWKGVMRLERKELSNDTFHVSKLKKCLEDANLHVPLDEIKVDKTLRFIKEPVEITDREIKKLKRRKIVIVKVRWNVKRGPEFT